MPHENLMTTPPDSAAPAPRGIEATIATCRSVQAFSSRPVTTEEAADIVRVAARAPSVDPALSWNLRVLDRVAIERIGAVAEDGTVPLRDENAGVTTDLYELLGICRNYRGRTKHAFDLHGAPVGLLVTTDRRLGMASWLDLGMFIQNIVLLAAERGLASCVCLSLEGSERGIREVAGLADSETIVCGLALGYENRAAPSQGSTKGPDWLRVVE